MRSFTKTTIIRAFRRGDNVEKGDVEMKEEQGDEKNENKIEDKIKNDVVVNSSLERTRRLLKSRISVESGQGQFETYYEKILNNNFSR